MINESIKTGYYDTMYSEHFKYLSIIIVLNLLLF